MNRNRKKKSAIVLSFSLIGTMMFAMPASIYAAETKSTKSNTVKSNTTKEENVYATLNEDGSVQGIYVVNAYDLSKDTTIIDYGVYTSLKNLSNENTIEESKGEISVEAQKGKFYYQGDLETKDLPWKIQIHYYLDGIEMDGTKLAGKSGALKIQIELTQNKAVDESFFENYLMQATIALPAEHCTNIAADGATIANVSGEKQVLFNVMGGQEKTLTVTADVTDFEMSAISFKGVPMSFDIDVDDLDTSKLTEKTSELTDGVAELNDGAEELQDGTGKLQDGLATYTSGVEQLYSGAVTLASGVDSLQDGTTSYTDAVGSLLDGADTLAAKTENLPTLMTSLSDAVAALQNGSSKLSDTNSGAAAQISSALDELENGLIQMKAGLNAMNTQGIAPMIQGLETMEENMDSLEQGFAAMNLYAVSLQAVQAEYQSEADTLANILGRITESPSTESEPQTTTSTTSETTTTEGEYQEDYTDTTTEESVDEDGNKIVTITNNIYRTRENTTTITNETITNETNTSETTRNAEASIINANGELKVLYIRMSQNAGALSAILNGSGEIPGLLSIISSCQDGMTQAKEALFGESQTSMKTALVTIQSQLVGEGGALDALDQMIAGVEQLKQAVSGESDSSLQSSLLALNNGLSTLNSNTQNLPATGNQLLSGISLLQNGLSTLGANSGTLNSGVSSLQSGANQLSDGAKTLTQNNETILSGVQDLASGMDTLKEGTQTLSDKTENIDDQILDGIKDGLSNFTGQDYDGISFVSTENTNVDAVQFAMQTQEVSVVETVEKETEEKEQTFFEKLKSLF